MAIYGLRPTTVYFGRLGPPLCIGVRYLYQAPASFKSRFLVQQPVISGFLLTLEYHGLPVLQEAQEIGFRRLYPPPDNTNPQWLIVAIYGVRPTLEQHGLSEPSEELSFGVLCLYLPRDNIKPRSYNPEISGPPPTTVSRGPNEQPEALGLGFQFLYLPPDNIKPRWFIVAAAPSSPPPTSV